MPDVLHEHGQVADRISEMWQDGVRDVRELAKVAGVSAMTVRRRLESLGLSAGNR